MAEFTGIRRMIAAYLSEQPDGATAAEIARHIYGFDSVANRAAVHTHIYLLRHKDGAKIERRGRIYLLSPEDWSKWWQTVSRPRRSTTRG